MLNGLNLPMGINYAVLLYFLLTLTKVNQSEYMLLFQCAHVYARVLAIWGQCVFITNSSSWNREHGLPQQLAHDVIEAHATVYTELE